MKTMNEERVAFEAWLGITPKGAAHDLAYEAFKAGAAWQRAQGAVPEPVRDALARRCLWLAFCWNDHNFGPAHEEARKEALKHGIDSFDAANEWLAAAPATPAAQGAAVQWVPVSERLPQIKQVLSEKCTLDGREIPPLYRSGPVLTFDGRHVSAGIVEWFHAKSPLSNVTHWMPLPAAPDLAASAGQEVR